MSGDWIKMRVDLGDDPAVFALAARLKKDRDLIVGKLHRFWSWVDRHAIDGRVIGGSARFVDDIVSMKGFAAAMVEVGWLAIDNGDVVIPNYGRHNGDSAKERGLKNARQARWRDKKSQPVDALPSTSVDAKVDGSAATEASTREEKRREDISTGVDVPTLVPVDNSTPRGDKSPENRKPNGHGGVPSGWQRSNAGIEAAAKAIGVQALPGEDYVSLKDRVSKAMHDARRAVA